MPYPLSQKRDPKERILVGVVFILLSTLCFSALWALVKALSDSYSVYEVSFFRNFFAIIPATIMVMGKEQRRALRIKNVSSHLWRAAASVISMVLGFISYQMMPLADAVAISFLSPIAITALSVPLLGERVGPFRWTAVIIGFIGILIIVPPGSALMSPGSLVAIGAALIGAVAMITIRQLNRTNTPEVIVFYFSLFSTAFTAIPLPFVWVTPAPHDWGWLVLLGLTGGGGQYFLTRAFSVAPPAIVSPFNYAGLLWATLLGWYLWGDIPTLNVVVGAVIVVASGLFILYRETTRNRTKQKSPPAP